MDERGKSDGSVVPAKPPNNIACAVAEVVEERGPAQGEHGQHDASWTQRRARCAKWAGACV